MFVNLSEFRIRLECSIGKSSVVDLDPVRSALFGWIRIRIVTEKTDPGSIKGSQNKEDKNVYSYRIFVFQVFAKKNFFFYNP